MADKVTLDFETGMITWDTDSQKGTEYCPDLKERKNFDDGLCRSLFFVPNSADAPLCAMRVDSATEETVRMAMCGYETSNACSKTKSDKIWSLLEQLFDYVYIDRRIGGNPIRKLMQRKQDTDKTRHDMRNNLVKDSFSRKSEGFCAPMRHSFFFLF